MYFKTTLVALGVNGVPKIKALDCGTLKYFEIDLQPLTVFIPLITAIIQYSSNCMSLRHIQHCNIGCICLVLRIVSGRKLLINQGYTYSEQEHSCSQVNVPLLYSPA
jgi:hypothetical protein